MSKLRTQGRYPLPQPSQSSQSIQSSGKNKKDTWGSWPLNAFYCALVRQVLRTLAEWSTAPPIGKLASPLSWVSCFLHFRGFDLICWLKMQTFHHSPFTIHHLAYPFGYLATWLAWMLDAWILGCLDVRVSLCIWQLIRIALARLTAPCFDCARQTLRQLTTCLQFGLFSPHMLAPHPTTPVLRTTLREISAAR